MLPRLVTRIETDATTASTAVWLGDWQFRLPPLLAEHGVIDVDTCASSAVVDPIVCFHPLPLHQLATAIRRARAKLGADVYLVPVTASPISAAWTRRLLTLGADDVACLADADQLLTALVRGRRHVERLKELAAKCRSVRAAQQQLEACINVLPLPIFFKDHKGAYWSCNTAFSEYVGAPIADIIGKTAFDIAPPQLAAHYDAADQRLMKSKGVEIYETQIRFLDGTIRDVVFHKAALIDGTNEVAGITGAVIDVTERRNLERKLKEIADRDPLTGAYNRRKFFELAELRTLETLDDARPLSILVIDIDHFKQLNDRHGHACGDQVLCHLVELLDEYLAPHGFHARMGGEEFFAVLTDTDLISARQHAETVRSAVAAATCRRDCDDVRMTVSIGVAQLGAGEALAFAIERADRALYRAKRNGRNRVEVAETSR
ncbi:MAG: diguanylate cyclase [Ancalomicrobiaceae bacterium]|nr:diguanylate cyclase [Ancalomicrobiaceae bacterium]